MDHSFTQAVGGNPRIFSQVGEFESKEYKIKGISSYHDNTGGTQRGNNIIYTIKTEGLTICHMGDLGHLLTAVQIEEIGKVDILMVPVGGYYTIDSSEATQVVKQLNPGIVMPMHYKSIESDIVYNITGVQPFCDSLGWDVLDGLNELYISPATIPSLEHKVILFK